jgi:hypothetical protein
MKPTIWGHHMWKSIHYIALDYPNEPTEEEKTDYKLFFTNLYKVLPCYECSQHFKKGIDIHPLSYNDLVNSNTLFKWTVDMHNFVNKRLNKKTLSYEEAYNVNSVTDDNTLGNKEEHKITNQDTNKCYCMSVFILMFIILYCVISRYH